MIILRVILGMPPTTFRTVDLSLPADPFSRDSVNLTIRVKDGQH